MEPRTREELAEDHKLDIARTILRLRHRIEVREELNELEASIKRSHAEEVNNGTVSVPEVPAVADLASWLAGSAALPAGDDAGGDKTR
jgi:hypothetical protein